MRSGCLTSADSAIPFSLFNPQSRIQSCQMLDLGKCPLSVSPKLFLFFSNRHDGKKDLILVNLLVFLHRKVR